MAASIVDKRTPKWHDGTAALVAASTAPTDTQLAARVEAKRAEDEWYAGRLVDAYCAGDSLVRAMLGLTAPVALCVSCDEPTTSTVQGRIGSQVGPLCDDCAYWCDGNIIEKQVAS